MTGLEVGKGPETLSSSTIQDLVESAELMRRDQYCSLRAAAMLLKQLGDNSSEDVSQKAFWALASDLGKRALRSFHLEPLAKRHAILLRDGWEDDVALGLNKRVDELLGLVTSSSGSSLANQIAERLEALVLFVSLYPQPDRANHLVHALSAGFGGSHDLNVLLEGSSTIRQVVTFLRPFGLHINTFDPVDQQRLIAGAAAACANVAEHLDESDYDIPLPRGFSMQNWRRV